MASRTPRVLVVVNTVTPYTSALYAAVARHGLVDLLVLYCSEGHRNRPEQWKDLRRGYPSATLSGVRVYLRGDARDPCHFNPSIIQSIARFRPDVLVTHGYGDLTNLLAILFSKIAGIPYILAVDGGDLSSTPRVARYLIRAIVRAAESCIAGGRSAERLLVLSGASPEKVLRLAVTTDLERVHSIAMRVRAGSASEIPGERAKISKTILFVGRLVPEKGVLDLMDAFRSLQREARELKLMILGRGPLQEHLRKAARLLRHDSVAFIDYLEEDDFIRALTLSSVLVLPSHKEPLGIVAVEAFAAGTPVVLSDACGCVGTLPDSPWVVVFPSGSLEALKSSIEQALNVTANGLSPEHLAEIRSFLNEHSISRRVQAFESATRAAVQSH
jgi:glycosyltransferase involved in cell wall biosynthesis